MKVAWTTDIHLEFLDKSGCQEYVNNIKNVNMDALLITGDIGTASSVTNYLSLLARSLQVPIYFCLGNHDYYGGKIKAVRKSVKNTAAGNSFLIWLPETGIVRLSDQVSIVGHGGWADGRLGDYKNSTVRISDFIYIEDLAMLDDEQKLKKMQELSDQAAEYFRHNVPQALDMADHVIALTHVPPFQEAAWYDGKQSGPYWLPFFASEATGNVLLEVMESRQEKQMTVLCGHTHGEGSAEILPNLKVITGKAQYRKPDINRIFDLEEFTK